MERTDAERRKNLLWKLFENRQVIARVMVEQVLIINIKSDNIKVNEKGSIS